MACTLYQLGAFFISPDSIMNRHAVLGRHNQTCGAVATQREFSNASDFVSGMHKEQYLE